MALYTLGTCGRVPTAKGHEPNLNPELGGLGTLALTAAPMECPYQLNLPEGKGCKTYRLLTFHASFDTLMGIFQPSEINRQSAVNKKMIAFGDVSF